MLTKQRYYTKNRYFAAHGIALVMLIAAGIYAGTNGIDLPILIFSAIPLSVFIASSILFPRAYKRYVEQELAKQRGAESLDRLFHRNSTPIDILNAEEDEIGYISTRTDMLNTEEDD